MTVVPRLWWGPMATSTEPRAVLISGVYGAGKSSVAVEMSHVLENRGLTHAVLDLDFLSWFFTPRDEESAEGHLLVANLEAIMRNYLGAGIGLYILAGTIRDLAELEALKAALRMPLKVVRLMLDWPQIEQRLRADVTAGRRDDLREAANQIAAAVGVGVEELALSNDRPIREVALEILDWLGWI
jgi:hypothetical protein